MSLFFPSSVVMHPLTPAHRIIASCIPTVKQLFEGLLRRAGILMKSPPAPQPRSLPYISRGYFQDQDDGPDHVLSSLEPNILDSQAKRSAAQSIESGFPIMEPEEGGMKAVAHFEEDNRAADSSREDIGQYREETG